jgi:XapX domain-containing protein
MKAMTISFAVGLLVGAIYAVLRVRSPAPPLVALAGLLGIVWGEQLTLRPTNRSSAVHQTPTSRVAPSKTENSPKE